MGRPLQILFLAAEAAPFVKIGGLGDVAGSLPQALGNLPDPPDVRMVLPYYSNLNLADNQTEPLASFTIQENGQELLAEAYRVLNQEVPVYLINGEPIQRSTSVYSDDGYQDGRKFTFFSMAAMELAKSLKWQPDVLHAHDWHASPAVYNLKLIRNSDAFYSDTKSLLTVHNLPYMGYGAGKALVSFGLPPAQDSDLPDWAQYLPLPLGLYAADKINTVSNGYAQEMLTPEFGAGLDGYLTTRKDDLSGILNGLDAMSWNPEVDSEIPHNYGKGEFTVRQKNKSALLSELGLESKSGTPLLAMINRMDSQKGVDLVPDALRRLQNRGWQAVILGTGDPDLEEQSRQLDRDLPQVRSVLRYDAGLARRIYAGADMMLIPSRYEPCGLTQMIAMRYGCVPVARATGGLKDTIGDYDRETVSQSTGFLFYEARADDLAGALRRALEVYHDKRRWRGLQRRGMKKNFSWKKSAEKYFRLYQQVNKHR